MLYPNSIEHGTHFAGAKLEIREQSSGVHSDAVFPGGPHNLVQHLTLKD